MESARGIHDEIVYGWTRGVKKVYLGGPMETMNNAAWQRGAQRNRNARSAHP